MKRMTNTVMAVVVTDASDQCQQLNASLHTALNPIRSGLNSKSLVSNMETNLWLPFVSMLASKSWGHEYYSGQCPQFPPMKNFLWEKVWIPDSSLLIQQPPVCPWYVVCDQEDRDDLLLPDLQVHKGSKWIQAKTEFQAFLILASCLHGIDVEFSIQLCLNCEPVICVKIIQGQVSATSKATSPWRHPGH